MGRDRRPVGRPADRAERLLADMDAKVAEIKAAIRDANTVLKDIHVERKELRAHAAWAVEEHQKLLGEMVERSAAEVLRATGEALDAVTRQVSDVVHRAQSFQTLVRVDRLLRFVADQVIVAEPDEAADAEPDAAEDAPADGATV